MVQELGGDVVQIAISVHHLAGGACGHTEFVLPTCKLTVFDIGLISFAHVLVSVTVNEECNCKHVAIGSLVANAFAGCTLGTRFERTSALIGPIISTLWWSLWRTVLPITRLIAKSSPSSGRRAVPLSFQAVGLRAVSLYEIKWVVRIVAIRSHVVRDQDAVDPGSMDIANSVLDIIMH